MSQPNEFLTLMALDGPDTMSKQTLISISKRQISFIKEVNAKTYSASLSAPPIIAQVVVLATGPFYTKESRASLINRMM